jgi:outer membrane protein
MIFALLPFALSVTAVTDFKIAYVDVRQALEGTDEGKREIAKLKKDFEASQKKIDGMQEDFKKLKDAFDKQSVMLKEEVKQQKMAELQKKYVDVSQNAQQLQKEISDKQQTMMASLMGKVRGVVEKIGDRDGYTLILDRGETVLFYKRHMDITDEVIKQYNAVNK